MTDSANKRKLNSLRSRNLWIVAGWGIAIVFGVALRLGWMPSIDLPILARIHSNHLPWLQKLMYIFTLTGSWPAYLVLLALLALILILKKHLGTWLILAVNTLATFGMSQLFKIIFRRERPTDFFLMDQGGYSYPSGHAMVSVALYFLLALMVSKVYPKGKWKSVVLGIFSFLPGLSRLFMGVHYPTDVIMGWLLGISTTFFWYGIWLQPEKEKSILRPARKSQSHD